MKNVLIGMVLSLCSVSVFSSEILKCEVRDMMKPDGDIKFSVDVDKGFVDIKLVEIEGYEGYTLSVNVSKRKLDKMYILDADIEKENVQKISGRVYSSSLPVTLQLGAEDLVTKQMNFLMLYCKK